MSRHLNKLKTLVTEIEEIQRLGQNKPREEKTVEPATIETIVQVSPAMEIQETVSAPVQNAPQVQFTPPAEAKIPWQEKFISSSSATVHPFPVKDQPAAVASRNEVSASLQSDSTGKVSMELSNNIVVKFKLEESDETIEVRRVGENLAISFADGKSVHLPLKSVA